MYSRNYGMIIEEDLGYSDGMNISLIRDALITRAANSAGIPKDEVAIISVKDIDFRGFSGNNIVYQLTYKGTPVIFNNSILVDSDKIIQLVHTHFLDIRGLSVENL